MSYNKLFGRISYFLTWDLCLYIYIYIYIYIDIDIDIDIDDLIWSYIKDACFSIKFGVSSFQAQAFSKLQQDHEPNCFGFFQPGTLFSIWKTSAFLTCIIFMERPGCFNIKACIIFMDSDILIAGQCSNSSYCLVFLVFYAMACVLHKFMNIALGLYPKLVGTMSTGDKKKLLFSSLRTSSHPTVSQNQFYFSYLVWQK